MTRILHAAQICAILLALIAPSASAQSPASPSKDAPAFEIADVHGSAKSSNMFLRTSPPRGGRYEIHTATMVDLIRVAHGFDPDKILGGPSWLEMNHYDITAKVPADATMETVLPMLQSLLAERFRLVTHKETKPLPSYVLVAGKKPLLKEADTTGDTGCRPRSDATPPAPGSGGSTLFMSGPDGKTTTISLGSNNLIQYTCHNMTMEAFALALRSMAGGGVGANPILDETGIKGAWNFDLKYSFGLAGLAGATDRISIQDAVEKQLGLKLEDRPIPVSVLVVDSVDEKPGANPPGVSEALPPVAIPTEFDVVDIKLSDPESRGASFATQPGGRFISTNLPATFLVQRAFPNMSSDQIIGTSTAPDSTRFDITAKTAASLGANPDPETLAPLVLALLKDRFGFKYHTEERSLSAYTLLSVKPKLKKADPASRTHCRRAAGPAGSPPGTVVMTCQNITMVQFAEQLRGAGQGLNVQPLDSTGLEGNWDFILTWNQRAGMNIGPIRNGDGPPSPDLPAASDPSGGYSLFEAVDKQLGLKLEMQKRPMPVIVVDHLDTKPTDN